ncbi:hypothetical protein LJC18_03695 [Lachnospiraceae bacterium OttesenSCG-928-E19]|nr:hypothetical protein [Lachnospiraceae bacterium OttesenSCG-928-E19]
MKTKIACILSILSCVCAGSANANWQYSGNYLGDGVYLDDGSRFVVSVRGGGSYGFGTTENNIGELTADLYYGDPNSPDYAGAVNVGNLAMAEDFSAIAFAAGVSMGFTIPNKPQWRIELGWDHMSEMDYNQTPLMNGNVVVSGGDYDGQTINQSSGGAHSTVATDVFSVMAFHDFFDGLQKPLQQFIPYVGFGIGYADSRTTLNLADIYGDLSGAAELYPMYGDIDSNGILHLYQSERDTGNIAGVLAAGFSYGISDGMFLDLGARLTYLPKIKWALSNEDGTRHRDWFSAKNVMYANVMLGIRFEF